MANGFDEMDEFDGGGGDEFAGLSNAELYRQAYGGGTDAGGAEYEDGGATGVGGGDEFAGLSNAELYRQAFAGPARREEAGASLTEPERGERGRAVYGRVNLNALPTHDELAAKGERGGVETAMLNRQEETGIESDYDGSWWGGIKNGFQAFAHAVFGRPITNAMNANLQALARGTYTDIFGNETPLEQLPDATLDYVMDNTGANGFAGVRALLGERASHAWRGEDNIMRQWDEREGAKFADEAERKRARVAYAKELAQNMLSMQEESKLAASDELAAREETFKGALGRGLLEQGGYTARFMIGKYGFIAGVLEGVERAGELLSDKTKVDKNGEIVADAKRDTMGTALAKGAARGVIAPAVELVGGKLLMAGAKGAVRNTLGRIPLVKAAGGKLATTAAGKSVASFARKMDYVGRMTGMGSFPEEMAEEWEDQVLDAAIGLDRRASENAGTTALGRAREGNAQFFTAQNLGDLAKSMILMQVIQGGAAHALDRMNARRVDAVLENVCGVERGKLRNWTANQKQQAFTAWVEGLSEEDVRNMVDGGSRALNRFMSEMFGGHGMAPVALKDGEGRTVGRALVRTGRGGATAGEVNEALGEIRRAAGENDFTERDADGNPVERRFTPQTAEDGKGGRKPMWTPAQDEAGNPVLRLVDAENGVTIDSYDFPGDDAPTYRVYDARGRQRAADGIENALAYANGMVADLAQRNAKLRYIRRMAGDVLRNQRVFVGDTMADVRRDYDAQFGAGAFDRAMKSGDGQYIEGEGDGAISGASFWMPETDADGRSTLVPATDRDGNPVYETDAKGKPVLDAAGNPVRKMARPRAVFFALDSNRSVAELNATAYHEVARHSGLAQMYTPEEKADFLRRLSAGSFGDAKNRMDWDGLVRGQMAFRGKKSEAELWNDPDAVEEIFAVMTEGMTESPSLKQRFMANVYDWYRNRFKQDLGIQPDELAVVVDELNRFARRGGGTAPGGGVTYQAREGRELEGDLANVKALRAMRRDAANARPALPYAPDAAEGAREKTFGEQKAEEDAADAALAERMEADRAEEEAGGAKGGDARQTRKNAPAGAPDGTEATTPPKAGKPAEGRESGDTGEDQARRIKSSDTRSLILEYAKTFDGETQGLIEEELLSRGYVRNRFRMPNGTFRYRWHPKGKADMVMARAEAIDEKDGTQLSSVVRLADAIEMNDEAVKSKLAGKHFRLAKTSDTLKGVGLTGDFFTVRTGVVLRHNGKDASHSIAPMEWVDIADALANGEPLLVEARSADNSSFRIWTRATIGGRPAIVGADVKNAGRDLTVNSIATAFGADGIHPKEDGIVYPKTKKEIQSVLTRLNSGRYPGSPSTVGSIAQPAAEVKGDEEAYRDWLARTLRGDTPENRAKYGTDLVSAVADYAKALGRGRNTKNTRARLEAVLRGMADGKAWRWSVPARGGGRVRVNLEDALARLDKAGKLYGGDGRAVLASFRSLVEAVHPSVSQGWKDRVAEAVRDVLGPLWPAHRQAYREENRARYAPLAEARSRAAKRTLHGAKEYAEEQGDLRAYADAHPESRIARWLGTTMFVPSEGDNAAIHDWWKQNVGFGKDMDRATARFLAGRNPESGSNDGSDWWREVGEDLSDGNDGADWDRITRFLDALLDERAGALERAGKTRGGDRAAEAEDERAPSWYGKADEDMTEGERNAMEAFARDELDEIEGENYDVMDDPHTLFRRSTSGAEAAERARREYDAVVARYTNPDGTRRPGWMKAPNGRPTNLTERQWVQVRTPSFKRWFGDWEGAATLAAIERLSPVEVADLADGFDAKSAYAALGNGENAYDGRKVRFVNSTLGKILRHRGYDTARLVPHLKEVFDAAVPIGFEAEREMPNRADGTPHKAHRNFVGYHSYLGKITDGGRTYFVRFTVQELRTRSKDFIPNEVHSTFVSDVELYNEADLLALDTAKGAGKVGAVGFVDGIVAKRLADFKGAREASSKVVDANGEPLVVYHGARGGKYFTEFDYRHNFPPGGGNFFFSNIEGAAYFGNGHENVYSVFLKIVNPYETDNNGRWHYETKYKGGKNQWVDGVAVDAKEDGQDGVIVKNVKEGNGYLGDDYVVFSPTQIKSATDNTGAFDGQNPDIRFSVRLAPELRETLTLEPSDEATAKASVKGWRAEHRTFTNRRNGRTAELKADWTKIFSEPAKKKSANYAAHYAAANRLDTLFENGVRMWDEPPRNGSRDIRAYAKYGCPFEFGGDAYLAKITVKEYADGDATDGFYSIEAISVEKIGAGGINAGITSIEGHELDPGATAVLKDMLQQTPRIVPNTAAEGNGGGIRFSVRKVTPEEDAAYMDAVRRGDMETAKRLLKAAWERSGYSADTSYRDAHAAPSAPVETEDFRNAEALNEAREEGWDLNLWAIANGITGQPDDFFSERGPMLYMYDDAAGRETQAAIASAIQSIQGGNDRTRIIVYRAVPKGVKFDGLQSGGQWVSPSRIYAENHGKSRFGVGKYRIVRQVVKAENLWWDGNDAREWGYDDGRQYVYRDAENGMKLATVTYDDAGNVIPLSQRFNQQNPDIRFSIAGWRGLLRRNGGNIRDLADAKEMEKSGADRTAIWRRTGWWRGADGEWRFELPPVRMKDERALYAALSEGGNETTLGRLLDAPELFKAYPQLEDTKIVLSPKEVNPGEPAGWYDRLKNEIVLFDAGIVSLKDMPALKRSLRDHYERILNSDEYLNRMFAKMDERGIEHGTVKEEREYARQWIERQKNAINRTNAARIRAMANDRGKWSVFGKIVHEVQHAVQRIEGFAGGASGEEDGYHRFAGEVEARNVARRDAMTPEERAATPPWETEDVPADSQNIRFSIRVNPRLREEVEAALAKDADGHYGVSQGKVVRFADNLPILDFLGVKVEGVFTTADKLRKMAGKHHLGGDQIADLIERADAPAAVFLDIDGKGSNVILTDAMADDGNGTVKPVMVLLRPAKRGEGEYIASAYARTDAGEGAYVAWKPRLRYLDENKIAGLGLKEETDSQLKPSRPGDDVKTPEDFTSWRSTAHSVAQPGAGAQGPDVRFSIPRLYTGSAADYERPSLHAVGTGEGSQVYGWGLYASNRRGVAEGYAKADRARKRGRPLHVKVEVLFDGKPARDNADLRDNHLREIGLLEDYGSIAEVLKGYEWFEKHGKQTAEERHEYEWLKANRGRISVNKIADVPEHVYEQTWFTDRAPGDESHLLKWYEMDNLMPGNSLHEQVKWIRRQAKREGVKLPKDLGSYGGDVYESVANALGSPKAASEFLARAGIDGVKYPVDSYGGKAVKDGDKAGWNYVSFRDDNIRVDHKWTDGGMRFSVRVNPRLREEVEAMTVGRRADGGKVGRHERIVLSSMPDVLKHLGLPDVEIESDRARIQKIVGKHRLTYDQVADLPNRYDRPAAVFKDGDSAYVVLTDMTAKTDGGLEKPVMVRLTQKTGTNGESVFVASAYPREADKESEYVRLANTTGAPLYIDGNKIAALGLEEGTTSTLCTLAGRYDVATPERVTPRIVPQTGAAAQGGIALRRTSGTDKDGKPVVGTNRTVGEARSLLAEDLNAKLADASEELGTEIRLVGLDVHGSRVRGGARADSDLDVVFEYEGDVSEDALFDLLNENPTDFDGIKVDFNPIRADKTGTLEDYMRRSDEYDAEVLEKTRQHADGGEGIRFSVRRLSDGRTLVEVDNVPPEIANERDLSRKRSLAARLIRDRWMGRIIDEDGVKAFVNGRTSREYANPARPLGERAMRDKLDAASELEAIVATSTNPRSVPDGRDGHRHEGVREWEYRDTLLKVGDRVYSGKVNIKVLEKANADGGHRRLLHDITDIKDITDEVGDLMGASYIGDAHSVPHSAADVQDGLALRSRRYTPDPAARLLADALGLSAREAAALAAGAANAPLGVGNDRRDSMPGAARDLVDAVSGEEGIAAAYDTTRNLVGKLFGKGAAERWRALRRGLQRRLTNYLEPVVEMQRLVERRTLHRVRVEDSVADAAKFAYSHQTRMWEDAERKVLTPLYGEIAKNGLDAPGTSVKEGTVLHELLLALHGPAFNRMISERTGGRTPDGSGASTAFWLGVLRGHGANGTDAQLLGALARGDYAGLGWTGGSVGAKAAKAVALVRELTDRTRDVLEKSGRLGAKQRATWEALSPFYVPMRFDQDADDNFVKVWLHGGTLEGGGYARNYAGGESRHAFGHRNIADNPIVFAVQQHADAIQRATDNDVRRKLADMVRRNEFLGHVVDADGIVDMGGVANPRAPSGFVGLPRAKTLGADTKMRESIAVGSLEQEDNIVAFKEGGDVKFIVLGPRTAASGRGAAEDRALSEAEARLVGRAVKKTSLAQVGPVLKFVRGLTRTFGQLRTTLSPEFLVSNFLADNAQAAGNVYATFGAKGVAQFESGVPAALASARRMLNGKLGTSGMDAYAREMREGGGLIGGLSTANFADVQRDVEREVAKFAGDRRVRVLDFISHMAERMNAPFEVASRLSAYAVCRRNGMTRAEAAKYAREVTVDFNQKGEWTPVLNALYAFSNASLVDMERSFGAYAARRGLRLSFALIALGFLSSMLGYWQDDPEDEREGAAQWKDTKEYVKQNKLGFRAGTNLYSVPIRGVNRVLYYAGHKLWGVVSGRQGAGGAALSVGTFAASNLTDPIGDAAKPLQAVTPSVLRPGMELLQNESFSGAQIYREPMNRRLDVRSAMGRRTTPGIWHNVAEALNAVTGGNRNKRGAVDVQPEVYQYVYSWLTGSAGNDIARAANVVRDIAAWDFSDMEDARNVPFVRRFTSGLQANTPTFREKMDEFNEDVKQFKDVANEDPGVMSDLRARHPFFGTSPSARRWLGELTDLGKAARKLMKAEMSLEGEDRKAAHRLRLQVQAAFIHRFDHAPEEDTADDRAFARRRDREAAKVIKAGRK